ncbi:uncharacterized protein isoform X2 [Macaca fascicularis]|uniref:uncharacterized protein isoform X2 n=1 Tax=Macaca fascicularis TaxID=9541 RepID=UPI0032B04257
MVSKEAGNTLIKHLIPSQTKYADVLRHLLHGRQHRLAAHLRQAIRQMENFNSTCKHLGKQSWARASESSVCRFCKATPALPLGASYSPALSSRSLPGAVSIVSPRPMEFRELCGILRVHPWCS